MDQDPVPPAEQKARVAAKAGITNPLTEGVQWGGRLKV